ncbi:hypothetical protein ACLB2K_003942 [Fragaria x ananassa]
MDTYYNCEYVIRNRRVYDFGPGFMRGEADGIYSGIEEELRETSLDEETENWGNVDDFLWLRAVQSPNWSVLPEIERVGLIDFSSSEES